MTKATVVVFENGKGKFCRGNLIVARAQKQGTLYIMHARMCKSESNVAGDLSERVMA